MSYTDVRFSATDREIGCARSKGVLSAIGETPLVQLSRLYQEADFRVFAKLEGVNPGGSMKDRAAENIIAMALASGEIRPGVTVIESSSGNMGIGLAQVCAYYGLRFLCVVDSKTTRQNIAILRAYGAEIDIVTEPDPASGEFLQARLDRVQALLELIQDSYWPNQYANPNNARAHYGTMREIVEAREGKVDYLFCPCSTCGTLRGCAEYVFEHGLNTCIVAVDAKGSAIFDDRLGKRLIPGHGAGLRPALYDASLYHDYVLVSDLDCVVGCRNLVQAEGILAGGSSGGVIHSISAFSERIPAGADCVAILPDRGERYMDTIYSDQWVEEHFGTAGFAGWRPR